MVYPLWLHYLYMMDPLSAHNRSIIYPWYIHTIYMYLYIYISYCSLTISCCCPTNFQLYTIMSPLYTIIHTVFHYCIYYYISVILYRDIASFPFYITIYPYYLHYLPLHSQIFIIYHDIFSNFYHSNIFRMIPSFPLFIYIVYIYIHI